MTSFVRLQTSQVFAFLVANVAHEGLEMNCFEMFSHELSLRKRHLAFVALDRPHFIVEPVDVNF